MIKRVDFERGSIKPSTIGIITLVVIGVAYFAIYGTFRGGVTVEESEGMKKIGYAGDLLAGTTAPLFVFNKADYDAALKTDKVIVLYFYANWCPICRFEFPTMEEVFNELSTDNVIGFRVNYNDFSTDNDEKNLAREFGVAYQHTKVFVKNGQRILKSPEGWKKERYITEINKALTQ